jgi:hypothetical protein
MICMTQCILFVVAAVGSKSSNVMLTGTDGGGNTSNAVVELTVQTGGFTITPAQNNPTIPAGSASLLDTVTVTPVGTFTGNVNLAVISITNSAGNPVTGNGATSNGTGTLTATLGATSVTLPGSENDVLKITAAGGTPPDEYTILLTGTDNNGNTATGQVTVNVTAGFTLASTPNTITVPPGGSATASITAPTISSESGDVSLTAYPSDSSVTAKLWPSQIGIGTGAASTATISVPASAAIGSTYTVRISGVDAGGDRASTTINVNVGTPSFTLSANPAAVSVNAGSATGATSQIVVMPTSVFSDAVNLSGSVPSYPGIVISFSPQSVVIGENGHGRTCLATITAVSSVPPTTYTATITGTVGGVTATTALAITVNAAGTPVLSIGDASWSPNPAVLGPDGALVSGSVTALISASLLAGDSVSYTWTAMQVWRADPNADTLKFRPYNGSYIITWPSNSTTATPTFNATFYDAGDYIIQVSTTAKIKHADNSTTSISGSGYIGGSQSDVDGSVGTDDAAAGAGDSHAMSATTGVLMLEVVAAGGAKTVAITVNGKAVADGALVHIKRGVPITISLAPGVVMTSTAWTLSSGGTPVASSKWITAYGLPCNVVITPLVYPLTGQKITYLYTTPGSYLYAHVTCTDVSGNTYYGTVFFKTTDLKPKTWDTVINLHLYWYEAGFVKTEDLKMAIPPVAQAQYPFTPAPSVTANTAAARGKGGLLGIDDMQFWYDFCATWSIGDWGKSHDFYPDLGYDNNVSGWDRQLGGNFDFGAMGAAGGLSVTELLDIGQVLCLWGTFKQTGIPTPHPDAEQKAIDAGYYWWVNSRNHSLSDGATINIHLVNLDQPLPPYPPLPGM